MVGKEDLEAIGLSSGEAEIYLILLRLGEALGSEIARRTRISRPHVYGILDKLQDKGLVSYVVKAGKKYYKPADPEKLYDLLKEKEHIISTMMPQLKEFYAAIKPKLRIEVYEGKEGIKTVLNDIIRTGKDIIVWGASARIENIVPIEAKRYLKQRQEKKIRARQLYARGTKVLPSPLSEFKELPPEFAGPSTTTVYGNKVAIILWVVVPTIVVIESKELAESYKDHFELMWKSV
jgi:sugar-specific transcriptional regulator TrmB